MTERSCIYYDPRNKPCCTECGSDLTLCTCANPDEAAHQRLTSRDGVIVSLIMGELQAVRAQSPGQQHHLANLTKEAGELAHSMIQHDLGQSGSPQEVLRDAIQVATIAIRIATEGDDNFLYEFPAVEDDLPSGPVGRQYD